MSHFKSSCENIIEILEILVRLQYYREKNKNWAKPQFIIHISCNNPSENHRHHFFLFLSSLQYNLVD